MSHACGSCMKWEEHYYWNHMDEKKMHFFKLMTGDFTHSISIPAKFASNFKGQISEAVDINAPSGKTWHIGVTKIADELFLLSGWEDFVKAHGMQENDLLLFRYNGNSSFEVLIFDASGCEKPSSLFIKNNGSNVRRKDEHFVGERGSLSNSDDSGMPARTVGFPHKSSNPKKSSENTRKETESPNCSDYDVKHEPSEQQESEGPAMSDYFYSRHASDLTSEEREEILELAALQPGNPAFIMVVQMSHIRRKNCFLIVPSRFAAAHLQKGKQEIALQRPNRKEKWYVRYYYKDYIRGFNCYRWLKFVHDNKLREGYICIFELMKGERRVTMTVHVIRKVEGCFVLVG